MLKPLVFVIDKEKALSKLFCNWLNDWDYETLGFSSIHESIPHWEQQPNAIIVDLKTVNNEKKLLLDIYNKFKIPVILIAHYTDYDIIENNNFFDICPFPVEPKHLRQIIKNATNYHKLLLENQSLQSTRQLDELNTGYISREIELTRLIKKARMNLNKDSYIVIGEKSVGKTAFIEKIILNNESTNYKMVIINSENTKELEKNISDHFRKTGTKVNDKKIIEIRIPYSDNYDYDIHRLDEIGIRKDDIFIIPPLRRRPHDLLYFIFAYIDQYNKSSKIHIKGIAAETEKKLLRYNWPGNFEELKIIIGKAFLLSHSGLIQPEHVLLNISDDGENETAEELIINKIIPWELIKKKVILSAYEKCHGNIFMAAKKLKIGRATMYRLLHKYKMI